MTVVPLYTVRLGAEMLARFVGFWITGSTFTRNLILGRTRWTTRGGAGRGKSSIDAVSLLLERGAVVGAETYEWVTRMAAHPFNRRYDAVLQVLRAAQEVNATSRPTPSASQEPRVANPATMTKVL